MCKDWQCLSSNDEWRKGCCSSGFLTLPCLYYSILFDVIPLTLYPLLSVQFAVESLTFVPEWHCLSCSWCKKSFDISSIFFLLVQNTTSGTKSSSTLIYFHKSVTVSIYYITGEIKDLLFCESVSVANYNCNKNHIVFITAGKFDMGTAVDGRPLLSFEIWTGLLHSS